MKNIQKFGAFSAFYLAFSYLVGIIIFLLVLNYPSIAEPSQKIDMLIRYQALISVTNLLMYVIFGLFLVGFLLSIYSRLKEKSAGLIQAAFIIGIIWAGLLIGSGMVANSGIKPAIQLYQNDPAQAAVFWIGIESVANGLGGANGEILGGLMTLLISLAGMRSGLFPKGLNYLGILVGAVGIISTIPGLADFAGLFGMSQIVWFIWIGAILIKTKDN